MTAAHQFFEQSMPRSGFCTQPVCYDRRLLVVSTLACLTFALSGTMARLSPITPRDTV